MKRLFFTIFTFAFIVGLNQAFCQQKYERKSISYINVVWPASPQAKKLKEAQNRFILKSVKEAIEMPRFDYNPLPDKLVKDFARAAKSREKVSVDELAGLMNEKLMPMIIEILEGAMPDRAGELVSEEKKQRFMATKAKEIGITLEEIEKVMNSAYIYLPVITGYEQKVDKEKKKSSCKVEGGIIWFHLDMSGDEPAVKLLAAKTTSSQGFGSRENAFKSAVTNFARNLQVATRDIDEFKLGATISEVEGRHVTFDLGRKEGIFLDDCYFVGEWELDNRGERKLVQTGWVRVGRVADNRKSRTARSSAWAVKRGDWAPGMSLIEHPRLNIDIAFKPTMYHMKIGTGSIPIFGGPFTDSDSLNITDEFDSYAPGLDIDFQFNIGSLVNSGQTFFLLGGNVAIANVDIESSLDLGATTPPFIYGFHCGFLKKAYLGRLALSAEATAGLLFYTVVQKFTFLDEDYTYKIKNNTVGGQLNLALEYAATPDVHIGVRGGYRLYAVSDSWTMELDDASHTDAGDDYPEVDHSGLAFGLYIHYTPPALPFDPISLFRGAVSEE